METYFGTEGAKFRWQRDGAPPNFGHIRGRLDHSIFVGISNKTKTEEREATLLFGTQENTPPFPLEYCSAFTFLQE